MKKIFKHSFYVFLSVNLLTTVLHKQVPEYRTLYDKAIEAHDAKKKTAANKGKFELLPKTPVLGTRLPDCIPNKNHHIIT